MERIYTIGVYGWNADRWLAALVERRCDLLVDIRARRGVRGREYAFANRRRLEAALTTKGIAYVHVPDLAPTPETRQIQRSIDRDRDVRKRTREQLAPAFVQAYLEDVGARTSWPDALGRINAARPALLCVERSAGACHRSVASDNLARIAGADVEDIEP
jgi:uncharacterized protein (DUF488 family)